MWVEGDDFSSVRRNVGDLEHAAWPHDAQLRSIEVDFDGSNSQLPPFSHGLTLMFGKNATGKTSLMRSLQRLGAGVTSNFPIVKLQFTLPSREDDDDYQQYVSEVRAGSLWGSIELQRELTNIENYHLIEAWDKLVHRPTIAALSRRLWLSANETTVLVEGRSLSAAEILDLYDFDDTAIESLMRHGIRQQEEIAYDWMNLEIDFEASTATHRSFLPQLFLQCIRNSTFQVSSELLLHPAEVEIADDRWIQERSWRALLIDGLREMLDRAQLNVSHPVTSNKSGGRMWLSARPKPGGDLETLLSRINEQREKVVEEYPGQYLVPLFPFDLFSRDSRTGEISLKPFDTETGEIVAVTAVPMSVDSDEVVRSLLADCRWSYSWDRKPEEPGRSIKRFGTEDEQFNSISPMFDPDSTRDLSPRGSLYLEGVESAEEDLASTSEILRRIDLGVHTLSLRAVETAGLDDSSQVSGSERLRFSIEIEASESASRTPLENASSGQIDAIYTVLQIVRASRRAHGFRPGMNMVLLDEFDRHLHPSAAERLLIELNSFGRENAVSVLASTHSVPLMNRRELQGCPRLFAWRNEHTEIAMGSLPPSGFIDTAELLGVGRLQAKSLSRVHIVVEGYFDRLVIEALLQDPQIDSSWIEIIELGGIRTLASLWSNSLRLFTSPMLVVYDRRSDEFEDAWAEATSGEILDWDKQSKLRTIEARLMERRRESRKSNSRLTPGDEELSNLLRLSRTILDREGVPDFRDQARRLTFGGIQEDDIIDTLPIELFKKSQIGSESSPPFVPEASKTWQELRLGNGQLAGEQFKLKFGINTERIKTVLKLMEKKDYPLDHPSLLGIATKVRGLLDRWID